MSPVRVRAIGLALCFVVYRFARGPSRLFETFHLERCRLRCLER